METQRTDFLVGLFLLVTVGVVAGTLIVTSDLGVVRNDLYLRVASAEDLTSDTRVVLQGLPIGRVRQVNPVVDTLTQRISFIARLAVQDRFPNGTELRLPVGTRAVISQSTPIAPTIVDLVPPERIRFGAFVAPGDTLEAERSRNALDELGEIAGGMRGELEGILAGTRDLLLRTDTAVRQAQATLATNGPLVEQVLRQLGETLARTQGVLADVGPRIGPLYDSLTAAISDTRAVLATLDTIASAARDLTVENRDVVRDIAESLRRSTTVLEHFADQVSRRPTRLLTGVTPPPDTARSRQ